MGGSTAQQDGRSPVDRRQHVPRPRIAEARPIHVHRLGRRLCTINPKDFTMSDAVAFMTGAKVPPPELAAA